MEADGCEWKIMNSVYKKISDNNYALLCKRCTMNRIQKRVAGTTPLLLLLIVKKQLFWCQLVRKKWNNTIFWLHFFHLSTDLKGTIRFIFELHYCQLLGFFETDWGGSKIDRWIKWKTSNNFKYLIICID